MRRPHKWTITQCLLGALLVVVIITGIAYLSNHLLSGQLDHALLQHFGFVGIVIVGLIAGLNTFVPIPAASFSPLFLEAGYNLPVIIVALSVGTIIADLVGYIFGQWSREFFVASHPRVFTFFSHFAEKNNLLIIGGLFLYAMLIPFPNELMIIPLAMAGIRFRLMFFPLFFGNMLNHTLVALGITNILEVLL